jgi:hypothetical protein
MDGSEAAVDEIGRNYLTLALNLDRHFEGFVDAYFGPPELQARVALGEPRPLESLADDARQIHTAIEASDYDAQRKDFLMRQTRAMTAVIRSLSGDRLEFEKEVELYFDIKPEMTDEALFEAAHTEMDRLLPGDGALVGRVTTWKRGLGLEADRVMRVFDMACQETHRHTLALFDLPPGEDLSLQLVSEQPWAAYNWYLGDYRSRIDLNTDLPLHAHSAVPLLAHEAYPGHHTEHAIKEYRLFQQQGRAEHAIQLLLAPECVLSEGIADSAQSIILSDPELAAFYRDQLYLEASLPDVDVEQQIRLGKASAQLRWVGCNAALLLHRDSRSPDEVQQYIERYGLRTPQEARQTMKFIQNPLFRSYIFNYATGKALLAPLLEGEDAVDNFRRLLSEPFTPTQVRRWLVERETAGLEKA